MTINEQNAHPLYKDAHERFMRAEMEQNIKAAAKYPEPLNPASWTADGLADHAAQEAVDMLRYIEALKTKCESYELTLEWYADESNYDPEQLDEKGYIEIDNDCGSRARLALKGATYK